MIFSCKTGNELTEPAVKACDGIVFTPEESRILSQYFTNTDKPVFGLINLPDVIKGALFARYSRSNKSLRRLFLDEFYSKPVNAEIADIGNVNEGAIQRATSLYDKMILDFGDDSVAQLGGAHIACEQVSNILTKIIEKGRIASYLEQSTRYVYYNEKTNGKYNYAIPSELKGTEFEPLYCAHIDALFDAYTDILQKLVPILKQKYPQSAKQTERAWESTIRAKACDIVRGLLPASTRSNLGMFASGQSYEYLLIKMYASENAEVIQYANMILEELRKIIPSFLTRVDIENRGKLWTKYIKDIGNQLGKESADNILSGKGQQENHVELIDWDANAEEKILKSILFEYSFSSNKEIEEKIAKMSVEEREAVIKQYCGNRQNRRHKPGRAFEMSPYHFEILSDYGAFRDLQRHRILTIQWQKLSPQNGYVIPVELEEYPELKAKYEKALVSSEDIYHKLRSGFNDELAQYAIPFAYRIRYQIAMNPREAFHVIELRSQKQGHYSYRKICIDMYNLILNKAQHKVIADCMKFVDTNFYDLSRLDAENSKDERLK
jgi:thymidylate synthase ThyX